MKSLASIVVLLFASFAFAQCPNGTCPLQQSQSVYQTQPGGTWQTIPGRPGWLSLYVNGVLVGHLDPFEGVWQYPGRPEQSLVEWAAENTPKPGKLIGVGGRSAGQGIENYGVDLGRMPDDGRERFSINGREVSRRSAIDSITAPGIPDDSGYPRLTVIGSEEVRKQVLADFKSNPSLQSWRDRLVIKDYAPDAQRIQDGGFVTPRTPTEPVIYVQKPDGTVLWRQDSYEGGAEKLASALRDKVPGYDPSKDPSPATEPKPSSASPLTINPWWGLVPASLLLLFVAWRRS